MTNEELHQVAWIGDKFVEGNITGVIVSFHGLGGGIKSGPTYRSRNGLPAAAWSSSRTTAPGPG